MEPFGATMVEVFRSKALNAEIVKALNSSDIKSRLSAEGAQVVGNRPEQYAAMIKADVAKWAKVIKASGIKAD